MTTPKIVSGIDEASLKAVQSFYDSVVDRTVAVSSPREAELAKLVENTFRHVNIALVNELAMFAHDLGIDVWEAIDAAIDEAVWIYGVHPRPRGRRPLLAHRPLLPLLARGRQLRRELSLRGTGERHQRPHAGLRRPSAHDGVEPERRSAVSGSHVLLVLGLAYKPNTGDARESPAVRIAELLTAWARTCRRPTRT